MLDESIPLTTNEFDEWGNPKQKEYYDYMLSYSPYDNVEAQAIRRCSSTPACGTRRCSTSSRRNGSPACAPPRPTAIRCLFKVNMSGSHGGRSGRFEAMKETAEEYAFFLHLLGIDR